MLGWERCRFKGGFPIGEVENFGRLTSRVGCCLGKDVGLPRNLCWEDDRLGMIGRILASISGWVRMLFVV